MSLALKTESYKREGSATFTNATGGTLAAGTPVKAGGRVGILLRDLPDGATDEAATTGRFRGVKSADVRAAGDKVGWDANGNPFVHRVPAYRTDDHAGMAASVGHDHSRLILDPLLTVLNGFRKASHVLIQKTGIGRQSPGSRTTADRP